MISTGGMTNRARAMSNIIIALIIERFPSMIRRRQILD